jgi:Domain of unknown function (DUF5753)
MGLARETKARGRWHACGDVIPEGFDPYIGLKEAASQLSWHEQDLVPGILQTQGYARTLIEAGNPDVDDEEISRLVHVRMGRQWLIRRATAAPAPAGRAHRGTLRRPVGGPQVMAEQLDQMAEFRGCRTCPAGGPVQRWGASWSVGPVRHPPVPRSTGTGGKVSRDGVQGRVHRSAVPGQAAGGGAVRAGVREP